MIIVKIIGGLGNQMFQYAYAKALENKGLEVKIDISAFETYKLHGGYQLDKYTIDLDVTTKDENDKFYSNSNVLKILKKFRIDFSKKIIEKNLLFDNDLLSVKYDSYIEGYFQCEDYFSSMRDELIKDFTIKNELSQYSKKIENQILNKDVSASLHIRRGDYISDEKSNNIHGACSLDYYNKAIELMNSKFASISFYIFSDDINWAKKNLDINNAIYIDSEEKRIPHEDIYLMSLCSHNIIANSSFSWWGAWLNQNDNKFVIAPVRWFADNKLEKQSKNIVCRSWVKL